LPVTVTAELASLGVAAGALVFVFAGAAGLVFAAGRFIELFELLTSTLPEHDNVATANANAKMVIGALIESLFLDPAAAGPLRAIIAENTGSRITGWAVEMAGECFRD